MTELPLTTMTTNTSKNLPLAVGAIVKESSETILEWIAYHRVVGVDYFWIADNGSGIATRQMLLDLIEYLDSQKFTASVNLLESMVNELDQLGAFQYAR